MFFVCLFYLSLCFLINFYFLILQDFSSHFTQFFIVLVSFLSLFFLIFLYLSHLFFFFIIFFISLVFLYFSLILFPFWLVIFFLFSYFPFLFSLDFSKLENFLNLRRTAREQKRHSTFSLRWRKFFFFKDAFFGRLWFY